MLSESSGISEHTISRIEHGAPLRPTTARRLADALGVEVADLMESPPVPSVSLGKAEALELEGVSDIDELARIARASKAEWKRLAAYDRVVKLSKEEYLETMRRLEELEHTILEAKQRSQALREKLDEYEAEGVFELAATS